MKWIILVFVLVTVTIFATPIKKDSNKKNPTTVKKTVVRKTVIKKHIAKINVVKKQNASKTTATKITPKKPVYNCIVPGLPMSTVKNLDPALFDVMLRHGDLAKKEIALTFDDGPKKGDTQQILDILKKHNAKATFFVVGEKALNQQAVILQMRKDGHTIGNHTYHHPILANMSFNQINDEIVDCGFAIEKITGKAPRYFRPPGGDFDERVVMSAVSAGYQIALWNVAPRDHECKSAKELTERIVSHISGGSIVLLHVGMPFTVEALPAVLTHLHNKGYSFVSLDQMFPLVQPGSAKKDKKTARKTDKTKMTEVKR